MPMESKRILIGVNSDLVTDARVHKVCTSLEGAGYAVYLVGRKNGGSMELNRSYSVRRLRLWTKGGPLWYAEFNLRLLCVLLGMKGEAVLCNDTDALLACYIAAKLKRLPLIFDAHELFPEVPEVVDRPFVKKTWQRLEDSIFPRLKYCYTVCQSIADYYRERYDIRMEVVRNIPAHEPQNATLQPVPLHRKERYILLYQGVVNVGRGIEWLIEAMKHLPECCLLICGGGDCLLEMKQRAQGSGCAERILFTGRIPQEELKRYTMQADLGFVLLERLGLSYYYALPNRIFDYMRFGVPVLATDFPEIERVVREARSGILINHYEPEYLATQIREALQQWSLPSRKEQLKETSRQYSWENEEKVLLQVIQRALSTGKTH